MAARHAVRGVGGRFAARHQNIELTEVVYEDTLTPGIKHYPEALHARLAFEMREWAKDAVAHMKDTAPWQDRTGDAREGLSFQIDEGATELNVTLYHTVDYGIWLEIRWNGMYAVIMPTIESMGPELMRRLQEAML